MVTSIGYLANTQWFDMMPRSDLCFLRLFLASHLQSASRHSNYLLSSMCALANISFTMKSSDKFSPHNKIAFSVQLHSLISLSPMHWFRVVKSCNATVKGLVVKPITGVGGVRCRLHSVVSWYYCSTCPSCTGTASPDSTHARAMSLKR